MAGRQGDRLISFTFGQQLARSRCFRASQCDMKAPAENQPRRDEEHEGFFCLFFVLFVSSWLILIVSGRRNAT
jgi:hypothetical protein